MARPQRWSTPFGSEMTDDDVEALLKRPDIAAIEADNFPKHTPLAGVLRNDTRISQFRAGDIVVREGDYGNSAFLVMSGGLGQASSSMADIRTRMSSLVTLKTM